jgi:hypothetical protein
MLCRKCGASMAAKEACLLLGAVSGGAAATALAIATFAGILAVPAVMLGTWLGACVANECVYECPQCGWRE